MPPSRFPTIRRTFVESNGIAAALSIVLGLTAAGRGDEFGRLEGRPLFDLARRADAHKHTSLTFAELDALPTVIRGENAALVLVETDQGNLAKMLVSAGLRKLKAADKQGPLVPVLILERYETIDSGDHVSITARGRELMLFDGFQVDLDTGQVVPAGLGGDIVFSTDGPQGPRLKAVGPNPLITLDRPLPALATAAGRPSSGRIVKAGDYQGRYHLIANGQWSGTLDLSIDAGGAVTGRFRSDLNGSAYTVTGKVAVDPPQKIEFDIQFPQARQSYEGMLWTEGKNAFAGTLLMLDRPYSFIAIREGTVLSDDTIDLAPGRPSPDRANDRVVSLDSTTDQLTLGGKPLSSTELDKVLTHLAATEPPIAVLLRVPDAVSIERVRRVVKSIRATGIRVIRLAPAAESGNSN